MLFSGPIRANIAFGRADASDAEIRAAARAARADEFVERLPEGYDEIIGERGVSLSGGQKQRLAIARALLMNPRILILDEFTSSVDVATERLIRQALLELMRDRTTFVIAHRVSTVRAAHQILVLEAGRLIARGRHEELLQTSRHYRETCAAQLQGDPTVEAAPEPMRNGEVHAAAPRAGPVMMAQSPGGQDGRRGGGGGGGGGGLGIRGSGGGGGGGGGLNDLYDVDGVAFNRSYAERALGYMRPHKWPVAARLLPDAVRGRDESAGALPGEGRHRRLHRRRRYAPGLTLIVLAIGLVYLANYFASARQIRDHGAGRPTVLRTMREQLFRHLLRLPLAYFQRHPSGVTVSRLINDVLVLNDLLTNGLSSAHRHLHAGQHHRGHALAQPRAGVGDVRGDADHDHCDLDLHQSGQDRLSHHSPEDWCRRGRLSGECRRCSSGSGVRSRGGRARIISTA